MNFDDFFTFIIPTGIGTSIGGYAGDGSYWAQKISTIRKTFVNPNVVNAACFSGVTDNMFYTEGWAIDEFFAGKLNFVPKTNNKIGIIFDKSIPEDVLNIHINTINAVKTVYSTDVIGYEITKKEVGIEYGINISGASDGKIKEPDTLIDAGKKLIDKGADVLAVVCLFPDSDDEEYANGSGVDPVGGIESIISHYITSKLFVPCVHAPAFIDYQIRSDIVDSRAAAEYITPTFLPCLLLGLKNAPTYTRDLKIGINIKQNKALIIPSTSLGSPAVFSALERNIPIYAIKENKTILNVTNELFFKKDSIIFIDTYKELFEFLEKEYEKK